MNPTPNVQLEYKVIEQVSKSVCKSFSSFQNQLINQLSKNVYKKAFVMAYHTNNQLIVCWNEIRQNIKSQA